MIRKELLEFVTEMEERLKKHDKDRGETWKTCPLTDLIVGMNQEIAEYAISGNSVELPDIANYLAFLWWRMK